MRPVDMQPIGDELAIKWDDDSESFVRLEHLRRCCPCAGCQGERDVLGNLYRPAPQTLTPASWRLDRLVLVGGYAVQPIWADGHDTGLYTFDYLQEIADAG